MTYREIAEVIPPTPHPRPSKSSVETQTRWQLTQGQRREIEPPSIPLGSIQHYEHLAQRRGWYQFRIEGSITRPDVDPQGIYFEVYDENREFVAALNPKWSPNASAALTAVLAAIPTAGLQPQALNTAAYAAAVGGLARIWTFDVWMEPQWLAAWRGFLIWNDADGRVYYMGEHYITETAGVR